MSEFIVAAGTCILTGILTILNPCPLTTTIASITFLSGYAQKTNRTVFVVFLFMSGFLGTYFVLAVILASGLIGIPEVSRGLQQYFSIFIGPVLILVGMILADVIKIEASVFSDKVYSWITNRKWSGLQALPMGSLMALGFCPATAAIFFGILIPLAIQYEQPILFSLLYALGAALPFSIISILIITGLKTGVKPAWQKKFPMATGWILILAGIVLTVQRIWF